jgi:hypothetical protein
MAKFRSTTFGAISGKHGTAVATVRNGASVLRVFTPPSNPKSPGQTAQRLKFGLVTSSLNPLRNIINDGFGSKHGFFQSVSLALRNAVEGDSPNYSINFAKVVIASGTLPQSPSAEVRTLTGTNVSVTWNTVTWANGLPSDLVYICFFNPVNRMAVYMKESVTRNNGSLDVELPAFWKGTTVHVWLFFASEDRLHTSQSQYIGTIIPA